MNVEYTLQTGSPNYSQDDGNLFKQSADAML